MSDELDRILTEDLVAARALVGNLALSDPEREILTEFDRHFAVVLAALTSPSSMDPGTPLESLLKAHRAAEQLASTRPEALDPNAGDDPTVILLAATFDRFWDECGAELGVPNVDGLLMVIYDGEYAAVAILQTFLEGWLRRN